VTTRAVAYLRVSTDKQADLGVSLAAQRAKVEAYAALYDVELVAVEVDAGESASTLDRPALQRALGMLRGKRADALLVVKLDRLTRSVRDLAELLDEYFRDAALLSVGEQIDTRSAAGRLVLNILVTVGQWEREAIGERTKVALEHKAARGERVSRFPPYGSQFDGSKVVPLDAERAVLAEARRLRERGLSLRAVAAELARRGKMSRAGVPFGPKSIAAMCSRSQW